MHRKEQSLLVFGDFFVFGTFFEIGFQSVRDFVRKIQNNPCAAFSRNRKSVDVEVDVVHVKSDALRNTNTRAQKQREQGCVADMRDFVICFLMLRKVGTSVFGDVQNIRNLVRFKFNYFLILDFRHRDFRADV